MLELYGDYWQFAKTADCLVFTSNRTLNSRGHLVMGAGIARDFKQHFPHLPALFGKVLTESPDSHLMSTFGYSGDFFYTIVAFPTKEHWKDDSITNYIDRSCSELVIHADKYNANKVILTRPGCGLGGLQWEDVKPICLKHLDDRFSIVHS